MARLAGRFQLYDFGRWLALASLIGVVAGLGAAVLTWGVDGLGLLLHDQVVGFDAPGHGTVGSTDWSPPRRPWLLLLIMPLAGLLVGWLVQTFAPEAEGHGTDSVIRSFHREASRIRTRVVPVKLLASMLTIGSGGSAGREGPVAQVGAGFGSFLSGLLQLPLRDRRIMVVAGVAAGVGGMFRAPLGGALFAIEVLYSENEYESEALIPAIMAAIIAYVVNASLTGWDMIFRTPRVAFDHPLELLAYLVMGMALAVVGMVYVKVFYGVRGQFARLAVPEWTKPAIGAFGVAVIALGLPQVLGGGYGWIQLTLDGQLPLKLLLLLLPAKLLATALTIGSGGSGGVFAPSLVIGGISGAVFADVAARVMPAAAPEPTSCVLVGMGAFFAGVAKVPIAALIMVAEMSGSYRLLVPLMLAGSVSFLLTRGVGIYEQQVPGRIDSPTHLGEFQVDVLEQLQVRQVLRPASEVATVAPGTSFTRVLELMADSEQEYFPVVDGDGRLVGLFSVSDVRRVMASPEVWSVLVAGDLGADASAVVWVDPDDDLHTALRRFTASGLAVLPVLAAPPPSPLVGMISHHRVMESYVEAMRRLRPDVATA